MKTSDNWENPFALTPEEKMMDPPPNREKEFEIE